MKPQVELLEDRSCPATGMSHHAFPGWDVTQVDTWSDNAEPLRQSAVVGGTVTETGDVTHNVASFVELRYQNGQLWALPGTKTVNAPVVNGVVMTTLIEERFDPVLLAEGVGGASVTHTDAQFVATWQVGTKVYAATSPDRLVWDTPMLVVDLAAAVPVAGETYGLTPLKLDADIGAVVNVGPTITWAAVGADTHMALVIDVAWQDKAGDVHAAETMDGMLTYLDIDAAFAHPSLYLDLAHAYWN